MAHPVIVYIVALICSLIAFLAALGTDVEMSAEATFKGGKPNIKGNFKTSSGDNKTGY